MTERRFFATCAKGLEYLLVDELVALGAGNVREALAGVHFDGSLALGLRACLWSRLASRILMPLAEYDAGDAEALYDGAASVDWPSHLHPDRTFAVDAVVRASSINQSMFAAQRIKDAVVDGLRAHHGRRPNIDPAEPDLRLNLRLVRDRAVLSLDLAGQPLHRRGWRQDQGAAPLKETVAAAMLLRAGWPAMAAEGDAVFDPFCGAGTLLIEAAWMAGDVAPGLLREHAGCQAWLGFDAMAWAQLRSEADERRVAGLAASRSRFAGSDIDRKLVAIAQRHARTAGVDHLIAFEHANALHRSAPDPTPALIVSNLPFGARLGDDATTAALYRDLGAVMRERYPATAAAFLTLADGRGRRLGLRARRRYALNNGSLACELLLIDPPGRSTDRSDRPAEKPLSDGARMVANRLEKNRRHLRKRLEREGISCFRLYDADLPEYAAAVDVYGPYAVVQEYQAPITIPTETARRRLGELIRAVRETLGLPRERVIVKQRRRQGPTDQYQASPDENETVIVDEAGLRFEVRLRGYLDTGLYLDHRPVRAWIREHAQARDVLNLFCYTGAATVHAAAGGARSTTSVDLSATYLAWAQRNLELNGFIGARHRLVQADVLRWLSAAAASYDLIYVDPPTFSNSKRAEDFDVQRQHVDLLRACARVLRPGGVILFSNHFRRFKLDTETLAPGFDITDISRDMLPFDFQRDPRIHQVYLLRPRSGQVQ